MGRLAVLILAIVLLGVGLATCSRPPSDAAVIEMLETHRDTFEEIVAMVLEDVEPCINAVDDVSQCRFEIESRGEKWRVRVDGRYDVDPSTGRNQPLSHARLEQYRLLTNKVGLKETSISWSAYPGLRIDVYNHQVHLLLIDETKSLVFRPSDPTPRYESLDGALTVPPPDDSLPYRGYRKIDDDWYVFFMYW